MPVRSPATLHGGKGGGEVLGGAGGETGVDADRGVQIGVSHSHNGGHRSAGRHPGHVYPAVGNVILVDDLARDAGDYGRLSLSTLLVRGLKPVPALLHVGILGLRGIGDKKGMLLGELVHARADREVVGVLGTAVKHDNQRYLLLPSVTAGDVQLIGASP